jgi:DNA polymerase elongation subunit (family B)
MREQKFKERTPKESTEYSSNSTQPTSKEKSSDVAKQSSKGEFKGAMVLEPNRGLHYEVYVFDVTSLYPIIIINYNISPEKVNCSCCKNNPKDRTALDIDIQNDLIHVPDKVECY